MTGIYQCNTYGTTNRRECRESIITQPPGKYQSQTNGSNAWLSPRGYIWPHMLTQAQGYGAYEHTEIDPTRSCDHARLSGRQPRTAIDERRRNRKYVTGIRGSLRQALGPSAKPTPWSKSEREEPRESRTPTSRGETQVPGRAIARRFARASASASRHRPADMTSSRSRSRRRAGCGEQPNRGLTEEDRSSIVASRSQVAEGACRSSLGGTVSAPRPAVDRKQHIARLRQSTTRERGREARSTGVQLEKSKKRGASRSPRSIRRTGRATGRGVGGYQRVHFHQRNGTIPRRVPKLRQRRVVPATREREASR